ncbi:MAG: helix-turn-helix domain-containing protein [Mycobacterium sp.]|uniref:sigma-54-dependent Fis family transcriptional regulator n=1 Tax=Mycobacterium sp. TaxID=1785 RepID=UPI002630BF27|nr:helix-turn-helix domain-containing protein [Mycobacterium sp.]MDI3314814.1 helix-turn-helix domain-containing protein [Mycobacterium sp.]
MESAKARLINGEPISHSVRDEILTSWRRSRMLGADPDRFALPYRPEFDAQSPLLRAAIPVVDRLATLLADTNTAIILSDPLGRIVARRVGQGALMRHLDRVCAAEGFVYAEDIVGTNGLGTAVEIGRAIQVVGPEHFAERLAELTCVGVPILDPLTRRLVGVIDLTCHVRDTNGLLRPLVEQASRDISERLYHQRSLDEQALLQHFLQAGHTSSQALVAINQRIMIANARASRLLAGVEHALLWEQAGRMMTIGTGGEHDLAFPGETGLRVRARAIQEAGTPIGALLEIREMAQPPGPRPTGDDGADELPGVAGRSAAWRGCCRLARDAARRGASLVLSGEPGVGKFTVAKALHETVHPGAALVVADAAAVAVEGPSPWLSRLRHQVAGPPHGTLIVRNVDVLEPALVRGLRALAQDLPAGGWLFIATATGLGDCDPLTTFLDAVRVEVPTLRERPEDLPPLVAALATRQARRTGRRREFSSEVLQAFQRLYWPGNVAQLAELVETLTSGAQPGPVRLTEVPADLLRAATRRPVSRFERAEVDAILAALHETGGNKKAAAQRLGISRSRLYRKLHSVGIDIDHAFY